MMNNSTTTRTATFRLYPLNLTLAALSLLLLLLALAAPAGAAAGSDTRAPNLGACQTLLQVSAGNKVSFHAYAQGVQIYRWDGTRWSFVGPEAVLYSDAAGTNVVGRHYAGPTWESLSGSTVRAMAVPGATCTPNPSAIPWLLLKAVSSTGPGIFDGTTYIHRVNTVGGLAPSDSGRLGEERRVQYTAEYYFYRAQR